jgi:hypothetical protein
MSDYIIDIIEPLADATGYDFFELQEILFDMFAEADEDETTESIIAEFTAITLELDW